MVSPCPSKKKNDEFAESDLNKSIKATFIIQNAFTHAIYSLVELVPGEKPLLNHKFYLDLKNRLVASKLETQIKELGGVSVPFVYRNISKL